MTGKLEVHLINDADAVWHKLWSVRLSLLAAVLEGVNAFLGYVVPDHPGPILAILAAGVSAAAAIARVIAQPALKKDSDD